MATHSFTCKQAIAAFTPQPQSITTLWLHGTHFIVPREVEGWVDLGGWLHTEIKCRRRESNPDTVTHPSTNRARRRLTSLIETNALPLRQIVCRIQKQRGTEDVAIRERSAIIIQSSYRRYKAGMLVDGMRRHKAVVKIQAAARGYLARSRVRWPLDDSLYVV